jgi:hypothetical protein
MNEHAALQRSRMLLKYAFGATLLLIGLDKVFGLNLIAGWEGYVSELALSVLPVTAGTVVLGLGIIEIVVGILMITQWTRLAAVLSIGALALIVVNLLSLGLYDIAARDVLLALALLVLVWLTDAVPQERKWL